MGERLLCLRVAQPRPYLFRWPHGAASPQVVQDISPAAYHPRPMCAASAFATRRTNATLLREPHATVFRQLPATEPVNVVACNSVVYTRCPISAPGAEDGQEVTIA